MTETGNSFVDCIKDDIGDCCGKCPYNVVAVIPCFGRFPLLRQTVNRLVNKNRVKVLLVGDEHQVSEIAKQYGQSFLHYKNRLLGEKWNAGFIQARKMNPDAVLFVGSSDWVSDNWITESIKYLNEYDMVGTLGCHLLDTNVHKDNRLVYWPGYGEGPRQEEPIGIGRLISKRILDKIGWEPFDSLRDNSLDWHMWQNVLKHGGRVKLLHDDKIKSLSISTNLWGNKHIFEEHWKGKLPSHKMDPNPFIESYFPEISNIFK